MLLKDAFILIRNGASIKQDKNMKGIPITRIETISNKMIDRSKFGYANIYDVDEYKDYILNDGDILMSHINSKTHLGKTAIYKKIKEEFIIHGMNLLLLRPNRSIILPDYAYIFFNSLSFLKQIPSITKNSVNQASFSISDLNNIKIIIPSINRQKDIINKIYTIDSILNQRKEQLATLDTLVKSRFIEMFGDPVTNPMGWKVDPLDKHLEVIGGYAFKSSEFRNVGIPILRIGNINSGKFSEVNMVYWEKDENLSRYEIYPGDLVISLTGTVGKSDYGNVCIMGDDYSLYYLNQRNAKLSLFQTLSPYYLAEVMKVDAIKGKLTGISRGIRQANIANRDILNLEIPIPPITIQNQFADFVALADKSKFDVQQSIDTLSTLKRKLMQDYFG